MPMRKTDCSLAGLALDPVVLSFPFVAGWLPKYVHRRSIVNTPFLYLFFSLPSLASILTPATRSIPSFFEDRAIVSNRASKPKSILFFQDQPKRLFCSFKKKKSPRVSWPRVHTMTKTNACTYTTRSFTSLFLFFFLFFCLLRYVYLPIYLLPPLLNIRHFGSSD
jgi:hypothetical protein